MSNLSPTPTPDACVSEPASQPILEELPGRLTDLGGLPIRRLLPRAKRRLVGPWCFLDSYGPLSFGSGKPMDVPPHPHIGLQTVSWLVEGELVHNDSLGLTGAAAPGVLNLMTAGSGIAHAEETPPANSGRLRGIQAWIALPEAHRGAPPAFDQHAALPVVPLEGGRARVLMGELAGARSPARAFSEIVAAEVVAEPGGRVAVPLQAGFEHALVPLFGSCRLDGRQLAVDTLYYAGSNRRELVFEIDGEPSRVLLLGGAPFGETILMWWNFVARSAEEIVAARDDWQAGRRFGDVSAYRGARLDAPPFVARPVPGA
jgi:redox-sensitive bicupin YhaK (pirin superfamily)